MPPPAVTTLARQHGQKQLALQHAVKSLFGRALEPVHGHVQSMSIVLRADFAFVRPGILVFVNVAINQIKIKITRLAVSSMRAPQKDRLSFNRRETTECADSISLL